MSVATAAHGLIFPLSPVFLLLRNFPLLFGIFAVPVHGAVDSLPALWCVPRPPGAVRRDGLAAKGEQPGKLVWKLELEKIF